MLFHCKWGSPNEALKQLLAELLAHGQPKDLVPTWPPTITSPLVKAGCVPVAWITEGATLPTKDALQSSYFCWVNHHDPNLPFTLFYFHPSSCFFAPFSGTGTYCSYSSLSYSPHRTEGPPSDMVKAGSRRKLPASSISSYKVIQSFYLTLGQQVVFPLAWNYRRCQPPH